MTRLSDLLHSSTKECQRWREIGAGAPILLAASLVCVALLHHFLVLNLQAIAAGLISGIAGSLGHLGVAIHSQRTQVLSMALLVISALLFPNAPRPLASIMMLNCFLAGVGSFSMVFILVYFYLKLKVGK